MDKKGISVANILLLVLAIIGGLALLWVLSMFVMHFSMMGGM